MRGFGHNGLLSLHAWKQALELTGDEDSEAAATPTAGNAGAAPPAKQIVQLAIAELCPTLAGIAASGAQTVQVADEVIAGMKLKLRKVKKSIKVWDSLGTDARDTVSIWSSPPCQLDSPASQSSSDATSAAAATAAAASWIVEVPVGVYCHESVKKRPTDASLLRLRDTQGGKVFGSTTIGHVIRRFMPYPRSFRLVWSKTGSDASLYVWRAVAPSARFVALGHVCTTSDDPPTVTSIHCVPRAWTTLATVPPKCVWTDAGTGGKPGSLWVNPMGLLVAVEGHEPPPSPAESSGAGTGGGSAAAVGWLTIRPEPFFLSPLDDQPTKAAATWRRSRVKIQMAVSLASRASLLQAAAASAEQSSSSDDDTDDGGDEEQEEAPEYMPDNDAGDDEYLPDGLE